ncbi:MULTISPECIES: hypothetical protein [Streptomyces]|uniref:hypothetical protein n=1 Tax=Streptomyces TaxID=1883 RepID=UPI001CD0AA59|nr:hypothetical protein [Streptomyces sp. PSKA30]MBZ9639095.1 hypothetical protein [Streptomyces sp. PSKA30]
MTSTTDGAAGFLTALRSPDAEPRSGSVSGPASPVGLWPVATALHDELPADVRDGWALRLYALLQERYGEDTVTDLLVGSGLSVVHDWHRHTVLPLVAETVPGAEAVPFSSLARLHTGAAAGRPAAPDAWRTALHPVLLHLHAAAYDRTTAYAEGHAGARDYALSQGRSPAEADAYGHEYAELSCTANARAFAEAHALALSDALALAYAADDRGAYADTFPGSHVRAVVRACEQAGPHAPAAGNPAVRLSEGFLTALVGARPLRSR